MNAWVGLSVCHGMKRTAITRLDELLGPSKEEGCGTEECKGGGTMTSTDWRKLETLVGRAVTARHMRSHGAYGRCW